MSIGGEYLVWLALNSGELDEETEKEVRLYVGEMEMYPDIWALTLGICLALGRKDILDIARATPEEIIEELKEVEVISYKR